MLRSNDRRRAVAWAALSAVLAGFTACGFEPAPGELTYALSESTREALCGAPAARDEIARDLAQLFGTPADPRYAPNAAWPAGVDVDHPALEKYPLLAHAAETYRRECLHCHGVEGGGDGPSAYGLTPRPRDFRLGVFKYTALKDQSRPRRADILRTLEQGVMGTSMPNFQRLSEAEREGLTDYVRFLSVRGEVETVLVATWKEEETLGNDALDEAVKLVWSRWQRAESKLVVYDGEVPPSTKERIALGDKLFHDPLKGNCASCHGAVGAGDGPAAWKIGVDGKREPAYVDAWGQPIRPRDLRDGLFRGGARPIDLYRRIYSGIPGGPMPALGEAKDKEGRPLLTSDEMWCLVHYVRSLSHRGEEP
jgi:mono/diheme cytochrome c family protein